MCYPHLMKQYRRIVVLLLAAAVMGLSAQHDSLWGFGAGAFLAGFTTAFSVVRAFLKGNPEAAAQLVAGLRH